MISRKLSIYGFISAAALVSGALVGCGGSSGSSAPAPTPVVTTGGVTTSTGTAPTTTPTLTTPQTVTVTTSSGSTVTGTLPANETIPASGVVGVIPSGTPIISGLAPSVKVKGSTSVATTTSTLTGTKSSVSSGLDGEVDVDGCNTNLTVTASGGLSGPLILVPGNHTIVAVGPYTLTSASLTSTAQLTIGSSLTFGVVVNSTGNVSLPSSVSLQLPANGGTLGNGNFVKVTYPAAFATGSGTLQIAYGTTIVTKNVSLTNGSATYQAFSSHPSIPTTGVSTVTFNFSE